MFVVETIRNQYGEDVEVECYEYLGNGRWLARNLNCLSSSSLGLGTCQCVSHDPYEEEEVGPSRILCIIKEHPELGAQLSEEEKEDLKKYKEDLEFRLFLDLEDYFGMSLSEIERGFETCYTLGINPLPRLRQSLKELEYKIQVAYAIRQAGAGFYADEYTLIVWHDPNTNEVELEFYNPQDVIL